MSQYVSFPDVISTDFTIPSLTLSNIENELRRLKDMGLIPKYLSSSPFVMWDITYRCNARCIYCYNSSPKEVEELSMAESMKVAEQIVRAKCFSVCLTGGEPTLRSDLQIALAKYLHNYGIAVSTITNGWLVDEDLAKNLSKYLSLVQVSLDGSSPSVHDKIRGVPGLFERALNAIRLFQKYGVKNVTISFACTKSNIDDFPNMVDLCRQLKIRQLRTMPLIPTGRGNDASLHPAPAEYRKLMKFIEKTNANASETGDEFIVEWGDPAGHVKLGLLFGYVAGLNIKADGFVSFSPYLPYVFGNLRNESLSRIWLKGLREAWRISTVRRAAKKIKKADDFALVWKTSTQNINLEPLEKPISEELSQILEMYPRLDRKIAWRMDGETEEHVFFSSTKLKSFSLLNPAAARIFSLCDGFHSIEHIVDIVWRQYKTVPKDRIQQDVIKFIQQLKDLGLLE